MKVDKGGIPAMTGLRKDHKEGWDREEGPPSRPLVNGKVGPNCGLANLISRILRPLRKQVVERTGNEVISTEELLRWIEEYNKERERKNRELAEEEIGGDRAPRRYIARGCKHMEGEQMVVGSMDVKSLYPSCKAKQMGEHIIEWVQLLWLVLTQLARWIRLLF